MSLVGMLMLVTVVLLGILVGFAIPAIQQFRDTLRSLQVFLDESRPKLNEALAEVGEVAGRMNRLGDRAEKTLDEARALLATLNEARQPILTFRDNLRRAGTVLGALGPALAAGLGALWTARGAGGRSAGSGESAAGGGEER